MDDMARRDKAQSGSLNLADFRGTGIEDERRREPRIPCDKQIAILPAASEKDWAFKSVGLFDCSPRGLGLIAEDPIAPGEQFLAKLKLAKLTMVVYTVRYCTPIARGQFKIGAEFTGVIGSPDGCDPNVVLDALLDADLRGRDADVVPELVE
jgi:PilZ domain